MGETRAEPAGAGLGDDLVPDLLLAVRRDPLSAMTSAAWRASQAI